MVLTDAAALKPGSITLSLIYDFQTSLRSDPEIPTRAVNS